MDKNDRKNVYLCHMKAVMGILIVLLTLLASCGGGQAWRSMDAADSLMEQNPDSALTILQNIDSSEITSTKLRARRSLLTTQARVKTYRLEQADTSALPLLDYYRDHGSEFDRMRAAFYRSAIFSLTDSNGERIKNLLSAKDIATQIHDNYWLAKIYEQLADIYHSNHYYSKAVVLRHEAIDCYNKAQKSRNEKFAWLDLALDLHGNRQGRKALQIIDSIIAGTTCADDTILYMYGLDYKIFITADLADFTAAETSIALKKKLYGQNYAKSFNDLYYETLLRIKKGDSINYNDLDLLNKSISTNDDFARYYWLLTEYYQNKVQPSEIRIAVDSVRKYYNEITFNTLQQSIISEELNYSKALLAESKRKSRDRIYVASAIAIVFILCSLLYFWIIRARNLKKDITIHEIQNELERLKLFSDSVIQKLEGQNSSLVEQLTEEQKLSKNLKQRIDKNTDNSDRQHYISLLKSHTALWEQTSSICTSYFNSQDAEVKNIRYKKALRAITALGNSDNLQSLVSGINRLHGNVLTILQNDNATISQEDIYMLALLYAGASMHIISLILGCNLSTLYRRKDHIVANVRQSSLGKSPEIHAFFDSIK